MRQVLLLLSTLLLDSHHQKNIHKNQFRGNTMAKSFFVIFATIVLLLAYPAITHTQVRTVHADTSLSMDEIAKPTNWIARGGCWDFSKRIIQGRGIGIRPIAYFKKENYADFVYEMKLRLLSDEDGSYGMLLRFDEKKDGGYIFGIFPHGDFEFSRIEEGFGYPIVVGPAVYLNDQLKTWNTLKVLCKGTKFEFYLNDHLLAIAEDDGYKSGKIGLYLGHDQRSIVQYEIKSLEVR